MVVGLGVKNQLSRLACVCSFLGLNFFFCQRTLSLKVYILCTVTTVLYYLLPKRRSMNMHEIEIVLFLFLNGAIKLGACSPLTLVLSCFSQMFFNLF